jgi:NADH-quinone oxidoreductase subunit J
VLLAQFVFYFFALSLVVSSTVVIAAKYPVNSVLGLVAAFVCSAVLWIMQGAEFLGLALIFVYVGAIMTLFLFVVMMLNQARVAADKVKIKFIVLALFLFALLLFGIINSGLPVVNIMAEKGLLSASNTHNLGLVLYTKYIFEFELAAFILLVGMIAAIAITFRGQRSGNKAVAVEKQIKVQAKDRLKFAKFKD